MKVFLIASLLIVGALAAPSVDPRVTGGEPAALGEFPYQVSLQWGFLGVMQHVCGGSIIASKWILTAGHCVTELPFDGAMEIIAGIDNLGKTSNGQRIKVIKRIVNENYEGGVNPNDIALLKLESDLEFNDNVQAIKLPAAGSVASGDAMLSGWGSTSTGIFPNMPKQLQKVALPVLTHAECDEALTAVAGASEPLSEASNVCGANPGDHKSACSGDSGGPFALNGEIIGVVSWGMMPCGSEGAPSVFTRVSSFIDWINANMV